MNHQLVEILLNIYHIDEISKTTLCSKGPKCKWLVRCYVCPLGHTHIPYGDNIHYLKHLITLMDGMKYEP